ncbi:MAG TPA: hypothetical protein VIK27_12360 [Candidatus Aquilonibacter sp.]
MNQSRPASAAPLLVDHVAHMVYHEAGGNYPISGIGDLNAPAGYEVQRWHVPPMPVARPADVAVGNRDLHIAAGRRFAADRSRAARYRARFVTCMAGWIFRRRARPSSVSTECWPAFPIQAVGGIYDLSHPTLRLALRARGTLQEVRSAIAQASRVAVRE